MSASGKIANHELAAAFESSFDILNIHISPMPVGAVYNPKLCEMKISL